MLTIRICDTAGALLAEGSCSESGYFPPALASIYNAGRQLTPARSLDIFGDTDERADYPVGTRRATFGYAAKNQAARVLDDEVIVHVERT